MSDELKPTEVPPQELSQLSKDQPVDQKKIAVDIAPGVSIELDLETAKKVIQHRDTRTNGYKELEMKLKSAEEAVKIETSRSQLLEAIKNQNIEAVEEQVSTKYKDKIAKYEQKIFKEGIRSLLATHGVLPEALDDATSLALAGVKATLDGDEIKFGDKTARETIAEFVKSRPHLVSVKNSSVRTMVRPTTINTPKKNNEESMRSGLEKFLKK